MDYDQEIDALFEAVDETAQSDICPPADWNEEKTLAYVRKVVHGVLQKEIKDDDDIFQFGGDR